MEELDRIAGAFVRLPRPQRSPYSGQPNHWVFGVYSRAINRRAEQYMLIINPTSDFMSLTGPVQISSQHRAEKAKVIVTTLLRAFVNGIRDGDGGVAGAVGPFAPWTWAFVDGDYELMDAIEDEFDDLILPERLCSIQVSSNQERNKFLSRVRELYIQEIRQLQCGIDQRNGLRRHELVPAGVEFRCRACNSPQNALTHFSQPRGCSDCLEPYYHGRAHFPEYQNGGVRDRTTHWADCQAYCSAADQNVRPNRRRQNVGSNRRGQNVGSDQRNQNAAPREGARTNRTVRWGGREIRVIQY